MIAFQFYKANTYSPEIWFPNDIENIADVNPSLYVKLIESASDSIPRISRYYVRTVSVSEKFICVQFQRLEHLQDAFITNYYNRLSTASDFVVAFSKTDTSFIGRNRCALR